ncbi:hypothetical protein [Priestia aryabhattai]|uniref:hypothetical protein n=1 Tax=Priestia aryabhattai TaxID=412384 RepID=UPI0032E887FE
MEQKELFEMLETKSIIELKNEKDTLINLLNKIPDCVSFFKDLEIDGEKFYSEKQYEILRENPNHYFIKSEIDSNKMTLLPKSLEEDVFVLCGIFNLEEVIE